MNKFLMYKQTPLVNLSPKRGEALKPPFPRREATVYTEVLKFPL